MAGKNTAGALSPELLTRHRDKFEEASEYKVRLNALTRTALSELTLDREVIATTEHVFSHVLDDWSVTNQEHSGRCWCFAGLNLLRGDAMRKMKLKNFEFSQNWTLFWDKIERANYFLEQIIDTVDRPTDDRTVAFLLQEPINDGGQWHMFVDLVKKYGLVPKSVMPETHSSSKTTQMNDVLRNILRQTARDIRANRAKTTAMRKIKNKAMTIVYRILCMHLGKPPQSFLWQWRDKHKKFHRKQDMTPLRFAKKYVATELDDYVCLVNDPRPENPFNRTYTVDRLGNVVGGRQIIYLNVAAKTMKQATLDTLLDGNPVWMGCDVVKMMQRKLGIWDKDLFDYAGFYDVDFNLTKADSLSLGHSAMTHAMLFTGVDVTEENGVKQARRWRVENSWGGANGAKGFYVMNDNWFDEHIYEVAIHKQYLPKKLLAKLADKPTVLPPWDPMGALA